MADNLPDLKNLMQSSSRGIFRKASHLRLGVGGGMHFAALKNHPESVTISRQGFVWQAANYGYEEFLMRQELRVEVSEQSKVPFARVPCDCMWDLIEYLSYQRASVTYDFKSTHFTVAFQKQSAASAQELLDHWAHSPVEYAEAC